MPLTRGSVYTAKTRQFLTEQGNCRHHDFALILPLVSQFEYMTISHAPYGPIPIHWEKGSHFQSGWGNLARYQTWPRHNAHKYFNKVWRLSQNFPSKTAQILIIKGHGSDIASYQIWLRQLPINASTKFWEIGQKLLKIGERTTFTRCSVHLI